MFGLHCQHFAFRVEGGDLLLVTFDLLRQFLDKYKICNLKFSVGETESVRSKRVEYYRFCTAVDLEEEPLLLGKRDPDLMPNRFVSDSNVNLFSVWVSSKFPKPVTPDFSSLHYSDE